MKLGVATVSPSGNITAVQIVHNNMVAWGLNVYILPFTALPNGVTVGNFLNDFDKYKVVGGTSIQRIVDSTLDSRVISVPDNTIPLTLTRANTVNGLAVL